MTTLEKGFAKTSGMYYERLGVGTPIVLIHGWNLDTRMWDGIFEDLAQEFQVIRFDLRGFGQSPASTEPYSPYADIASLLDDLGIEQAYLVGHSMGGAIQLEVACAYPERVLGLVHAYGAMMGAPRSESIQETSKMLFELAQAGEQEKLLQRDIETLLDGPNAEPGRVGGEIRERLREIRVHANGLERDFSMIRVLEPLPITRLEEIQVPLLTIYGDLDWPDFEEISNLLVERVPHAKQVFVEGTAHMGPMEKPQEFAQLVREFVKK
ncbi:alpha/beta hydrolase [Tumebacillus sp. ITR2]|uniref:Alpha/beta hydrolase n=1 Tax=Tumebacillus amylolyticus TaxID=2801339 RepID=A0ABS1J9H2_9BACL|nr:alpha/beta hydrolase [Tumebacillus amylolyticus]MBL0386932.1 alpha/beta hydrolase [Tumebacillus amylolyticus]